MSNSKIEIEVVADIKQILASLSELNGRFEQFSSNVGKSTEKAAKRINGWAGGLIKVGLAVQSGIYMVRGLINNIQKLTTASDAQEQAEAALAQAMRNTGQYSDQAMQSLKNYANELQKITVYGDEETLQAAAMLQAMTGLSEEGLKPLIKATQDFAAAQRMDLASAADLVGKALGSDVNALSRYGIEISGAVGSSERLQSTLVGIERRFKGAAEAAGGTNTGKIIQMTNALGDSLEAVSGLIKKLIAPVAENIGAIARKWSDFIQSLSESKLENAVRKLREMGIEAERLAGLEYMVNLEKATDALLENNGKIRKILEDTNGGLTKSTAEALGVVVKTWTETRLISHGEYMDVMRQTRQIDSLSGITVEKINAQIDKTREATAKLINGKEKLTDSERAQVRVYSQEMAALSALLRLVMERDRAQEIINRKGRVRAQQEKQNLAGGKVLSEDEQKIQEQINRILLERLPLNDRIIKLTEQSRGIDQNTLEGRLKYLQIEKEILELKEQAANLDKLLAESAARLARSERPRGGDEGEVLREKINALDAEYMAAEENSDKKKKLLIDLQNAEAEYNEWRKEQTRQTEEEIASIITGGGFGSAYDTVIERIRQKLIVMAIEEVKLALWVERMKFAIKEAWAGRSLALQEMFSAKEIMTNLKTAASGFVAGMVNLFKSVMSIPFPGNLIAFSAGGAAVIGLLNSFKSKGKAIIKAAEGALIDKPTLALVGEAVAKTGPEIIMPEVNLRKYMESRIIPEFKTKLDTVVTARVDNTGIHERLERVERAVRESAQTTGKIIARYQRGKLY